MEPTRRVALGAALGGGLALASGAQAAPQKIVSLNPCLDTLLVHLADRGQIAALSHYAREDTQTTIASVARTLPYTYESAEEILGVQPDLVLASTHSGLATRNALKRLGVPTPTFTVPQSVDESVAQVRDVARMIGQMARGEALIEKINAALAAAAPPPGRRAIKTLIFQPRGLVAGEGSLADEMMRRTGFENVAARYGVKLYGTLEVERLIADPPELLLSSDVAPGIPPWSERMLMHPALASIRHTMRRAVFPEACLYCGGPVLIKTAAVLTKAREDFWSAA